MINLVLEKYCDGCSFIEPEVEDFILTGDTERISYTGITCKYKDRCRNIYEYALEFIEKERENKNAKNR